MTHIACWHIHCSGQGQLSLLAAWAPCVSIIRLDELRTTPPASAWPNAPSTCWASLPLVLAHADRPSSLLDSVRRALHAFSGGAPRQAARHAAGAAATHTAAAASCALKRRSDHIDSPITQKRPLHVGCCKDKGRGGWPRIKCESLCACRC